MKKIIAFIFVVLNYISPALASEELTFISCTMTGESDLLTEHENGPIFMFSAGIKGLQTSDAFYGVEQKIVTSMVSDRHKLLGAGEFQAALVLEKGISLLMNLSNDRAINLLLIPSSKGNYQGQLFGVSNQNEELWADMYGLCEITVSPNGKIPNTFFNSMYPLLEKNASVTYTKNQKDSKDSVKK